jgi:hypothetical protein
VATLTHGQTATYDAITFECPHGMVMADGPSTTLGESQALVEAVMAARQCDCAIDELIMFHPSLAEQISVMESDRTNDAALGIEHPAEIDVLHTAILDSLRRLRCSECDCELTITTRSADMHMHVLATHRQTCSRQRTTPLRTHVIQLNPAQA